jgi:hypothetical protein
MKLHICLTVTLLSQLVGAAASANAVVQDRDPLPKIGIRPPVQVPDPVAALVRPILDLLAESLKACGEPAAESHCAEGDAYRQEIRRERRVNRLLQELIHQEGPKADEALVVLMCFYIGESQEDEDAVIARGSHMLPYPEKYRRRTPAFAHQTYPDVMLKPAQDKKDTFEGAVTAIKHGWRGTWDRPDG